MDFTEKKYDVFVDQNFVMRRIPSQQYSPD